MNQKEDHNLKSLCRSVCRIHSTEHEFLTEENIVRFQPMGSDVVIQSVLYGYRDHIKLSEGKDAWIEFSIDFPWYIRPAAEEKKILKKEGQTIVFLTGIIARKEDEYLYIESVINVELLCTDKEVYDANCVGDWIEAEGELISWWDQEDILHTSISGESS